MLWPSTGSKTRLLLSFRPHELAPLHCVWLRRQEHLPPGVEQPGPGAYLGVHEEEVRAIAGTGSRGDIRLISLGHCLLEAASAKNERRVSRVVTGSRLKSRSVMVQPTLFDAQLLRLAGACCLARVCTCGEPPRSH